MKKTAIITGGSRGIGLAIATQLGRDGYNIVIFGRQGQEKIKGSLEHFTKEGFSWLYVQGDISIKEDREKLLSKTLKKFGSIQVLVNNAGVAPRSRMDLLDMTEESYDTVMGINTKGTMFTTQLIAKQMISQEVLPGCKKKGTIVNISSFSATVSSISRGEYCISKAGVSMLTTLYADRLAKENILVHEIRPGIIETEMTAIVKEKYDKLFESGRFPISRWGQAEDVANAVSVLVGDKLLYTTGDHIDVDGGFHIRSL